VFEYTRLHWIHENASTTKTFDELEIKISHSYILPKDEAICASNGVQFESHFLYILLYRRHTCNNIGAADTSKLWKFEYPPRHLY
jgi:hypothetical protein